jgi:SnoaL-like domain
MNDAQRLADRYVAVWNETDPDRRRRTIAELWTPDGRHYVDTREAHGYDALEKRITSSHEKNVRDGGHRFRAAPHARALRDMVAFQWEMRPADGERMVANGLAVLMLDREGRILADYLFVLPNAATA